MKLKKIVSAVSALAMAISMLTVANAASLGGKPVVEAEFEAYELVNGAIPVAYVNVTIDVSAAEKLSAYEIGYDDLLNEVATGNGITTLGVEWTAPTDFSYLKGFSTVPSGFAVESGKASFGPKSVAAEYLTDESVTIRLALKPTSNDSASDFTINKASVDGTNITDGNVTWSYHTNKGNIDVVSCSIPSYNEWAGIGGAELTLDITENDKFDNGYVWNAELTKGDYDIAAFKAVFTEDVTGATAEREIRDISELNKVMGSGSVKFDIGLKTTKTLKSATFTAIDANNDEATWSTPVAE